MKSYNYMDELIALVDLSQNRPLNDIVYDGLRSAIIKGVIPVGERINEKVYADYMNISRTPIRNAITRLLDEGIIEYIPNYGVVVKRVTLEDALEIYKIRVALDTLASVSAMELMTDSDYQAMDNLLTKTEQAEQEGRVSDVIQLFSDFNDMIYNYAHMPRLSIMVTKLRDYLIRFRDISLHGQARRKKALEEHRLIFRCMKNRDAEQMKLVIEEHLNYYNSYIVKELIRNEEEMEKEALSQPDENK